jgi:hypothetical protein
MPPYFHRFAYYAPTKIDRQLRVHETRDGDAFLQIAALLYAKGYEYGRLVLNYPQGRQNASIQPPIQLIDESFLKPSDLLVLTTRPPLDKEADEIHKIDILRSFISLENKVFGVLRQYFEFCSAVNVVLAKNFAQRLNPPTNMARAAFEIYGRGMLVGHGYYSSGMPALKPQAPNLAILYLLYLEETWETGPRLLITFGMRGITTLAWAYRLRKGLSALPDPFKGSKFVIAQMEVGKIPETLHDLSFTDDWQIDILVNCPL